MPPFAPPRVLTLATTPLPEHPSRPVVRRRRHPGNWLILGLLWALAVGYVALTATNYYHTAQAADRLEALYRASPRNVVGRGQCARFEATQPPTMYDPDSHCWINLTQAQIADGTVRPHDFPFDNAPYGRQRHWSSSFSWWLLILGEANHLLHGQPLTQAMTESAAWANPILFALFLFALAVMLRRRLDGWTAGIFLVTLAALYGVEWDFSYGRPDHHGLHLMAFLGLVLCAMLGGMGWVRTGAWRDEPDAGWHLVQPQAWATAWRWFTLSGVCGGIGLWIGSTQQCVCIGVLGAGAVLGARLFARREERLDADRFEPELWRHWSRVGAATSIFFYLLEYFPAHMEVHLEVNHPFMALAWLGGGELMYVLMLTRVNPAAARARWFELGLHGVLGVVGLGVLPLAILYGPKAWWVLNDPIMRRSALVISEGRPWIDPPGLGRALDEFWKYTGVLLLTVPLAAGVLLVRGRRLPPWRAAGLTAGLTTVGMFLAWTLFQNRWMGFLETSLALLALLVAPYLPVPRRGGALPLALLALTVPGWAGFGLLQMQVREGDPLVHAKAALSDMMGGKEAAWNLRLYAERLGLKTPARVMTEGGPSPVLHYYGGVDTVASFYWENFSACHVEEDFFMDEGDAEARHIARERQLDFVMVTTEPAFVMQIQWLKYGIKDVAAARHSLAFRLASPVAQPPPWLEMLPLLDAPMAQQQGVRIYRVLKNRL